MRLLSLLLLCLPLLTAQTASLTPQEISDGWIMLYDGESLFGWSPEGEARWNVAGGVLKAEGESGWLRSNSPFADFELACEFRAPKGANSGIFIRSAKEGAPHETGYEVQIWDKNPRFPTGSLVNHIRSKKPKFKANEWNTMVIRAEGSHFTVTLNGKPILDGRDQKSAIGYVGLQHNKGQEIVFRSLKLKPLGLAPIFNGKDLSGWREVVPTKPAKEPAVWTVKDGAIHVEHGGGQLETEGTYGDFLLQMDIRTNPKDANHHPNSGVFFRGDANGYWTGYESQIRNEYKDGDRTQPVDFGTGAIYNRIAARRVVADDGKYFTKTILANGLHLSVWVNGFQVTDWDDPRPVGENARKTARLTPGTISLQAHDPTTNLDFRNIRIAKLPK
ncbi:MAG: DUF1080 domain-containing protein [Bryobacteraceae bacterium]